MLIGEYSHTVDTKGRINFPSKLRDDLGDSFIVTRGLDNCLYVYSMEEWLELEKSIKQLPRAKRRDLEHFFFAGASEVQPDKQGRIGIVPKLREYAGIDKNVVVVGASDHVEIWDSAAWESVSSSISAEAIADTMDELGF
ncbi:protein MraZ [[Clostridium] methylpentosum DSM 5476]|jgi:MraZ protein|uniref:Transcriptional regulator MraZ n=1 Tax=[Clostridium] methylpentosum DSM 5476 TaxID=537013 RepID=C0EHB6_9FIRM|nr:protein MraZ [[Clostridium] methylpentosum DSM 5476]MDY3987880.1 division/cell wall cluster transcriptional repressor MraZ [Massilioclostridium sp.]MEE1491058.1 division/cell wall cluster transcriptional repressor MraZ [Massilioclostridium sp.]